MPEVVETWIESKDIEKVEKVQDNILRSYELDFAKHAPLSEFPKLSRIWEYIPKELAKENSKFVYGHVKEGARAKDLEDALEWLISAGLCYKVNKIEKPSIPISAYVSNQSFKIYLCDVGLLRRKARVEAKNILLENTELYKEFKGAMAENFVLTEILGINNGDDLYYWGSGNMAEVDFVMQYKGEIIPIEVKAGTNLNAKSLKLYNQKYKPKMSVKMSLKNIEIQETNCNIPLYLIWNINKII